MRLNVAISNFHNGQIVYPVVTAVRAGRDRVTVNLHWHDQSDGENMRPVNFTGKTLDAERFLMSEGVHLDAQGIY